MSETKSKALLIVSAITILAISSTIVALRLIYPPFDRVEDFTLEVFKVESNSTVIKGWRANNVWLRWDGERTELRITLVQRDAFSSQLYTKAAWAELVSPGRIFNISIPWFKHYYSAEISFDSIAFRLDSRGFLYFMNNQTLYNPDWEPPEDARSF
jgi:hypothetical protein